VVTDLCTPGFEEHSAQLDALSEIAQREVEVDTTRKPLFVEVEKSSMDDKILVTFEQIKEVLDVINLIGQLLEEEEIISWATQMQTVVSAIGERRIKGFLDDNNISDIAQFKTTLLKILGDEVIDKIKDPIERQEQKAQAFINAKIGGLTDTAMVPAINLMNEAFEEARPLLLAISPGDSVKVNRAITTAKKTITGNIDEAVKNAVKTEIIGSINDFIHDKIAERIYGMVDSAIGKNLYRIAEGEKPDLDKVSGDFGNMLEGMADDVVKIVSIDNIRDMLVNTAKAAWNNVDMLEVIDDITKELSGESIETFIADKLEKGAATLVNQVFGDNPPKLPGSVSASVTMDFNALKSGDFKNVVQFDAVAIIIESPVADVNGYVKFVEDDPVWGKSWQAMLNAVIKVPKNFSAYVLYINGTKARANADQGTFKFWILDVGVSNLGIVLTPLPISFNSAKGKVYQYVKRDQATDTYAPSEDVRFGLNFEAGFTDAASGGKVVFFDVGLGANIMDRGFMLEIYGKVDALNELSKDGGLQKSIVSGTGYFTYNSIDETFLGHSTIKVNMTPVMCSSGDMDLAVTKSSFSFSIGTREQPITLDVLCRNKPLLAGWFALSDQSLDMGAYIDIDINLSTGWIGGGCAKIKPWARFMFNSGFTTLIYWNPLKIAEASLWLDMYAGVGIEYDFCLTSGNFRIAEVAFGGSLKYVADPSSVISGTLKGRVTVLNVGFGVNFNTEINL
jgi:hypothetical protein